MKKLNKNKIKTNIVKNFWYCIKKIYRIDKNYIIGKIICVILGSIKWFLYAYILKTAVQSLEENVGFEKMLINVVIIISATYITELCLRTLREKTKYKEERIFFLLHLERGIWSLNTDYELLERPEIQDAIENDKRHMFNRGSIIGIVNHGFIFSEYLITFLIACGIIISMNVLLIFAIIILSSLKMIIENKNRIKEKQEYYDITPSILRRISYTNNISTNLDIGKDLRIYAMNKFINKERQDATSEIMNVTTANNTRNYKYQVLISFINFFDSIALYSFLIYEVIYNNMTISTFTFMLAAVSTLVNSLGNVIIERGKVLESSFQTDDYLKLNKIGTLNDHAPKKFIVIICKMDMH